MRRTPRRWSTLGLFTLGLAALPVSAWGAGPPDWVSLVRKDDNFDQAWAIDPNSGHEALPEPAASVTAVERSPRSPLPPIVENPLGKPPTPDATWVRGYWRWDVLRSDFAWVPGAWVSTPPGRFWVDGDWKRDDRGWYRVAGFWSTRRQPAASSNAVVDTPPPASAVPTSYTTRTVARRQIVSADNTQTMTLPLPSATVPEAVPPLTSTTTTLNPSQQLDDPNLVVPTPQSVESVPATVVETPAPQVPTQGAPVYVSPTASVVALADQLAGQAAAFEQVFGRTARVTPGGGSFLAEARQIRSAAMSLRQAASAGDLYSTTQAYNQVNYAWQRMANRVNQISPGRTGPNIQQIWLMGGTTAQIGGLLR